MSNVHTHSSSTVRRPAPQHHPDEAVLLDYATGALSEAESLAVATHAALCAQCTAEIRAYEDVGGALLDAIEPVAMNDDSLEKVLSKIDVASVVASSNVASSDRRVSRQDRAALTPSGVSAATHDLDRVFGVKVPSPLRQYVEAQGTDVGWRRVIPGLDEVKLSASGATSVRLMRIQPGAVMPSHTHEGCEYTVVLAGGFSDSSGHYGPGDMAMTGAEHDHSPVADADEPCICLAVTTAPLRLTGTFSRWLNPFVRF